MDPNQESNPEPNTDLMSAPGQVPLDPGAKMIKRGLIGFAVIVVAGLAWVAWSAYQSARFHVVSTNPDIKSVNTVTPFLKVTFNQTLVKDGISITSNPNIVTGYSVSDKTLTILLKTPTDQATQYEVTIKSIKDAQGDKLSNKSFSFTPQYVAPKDVPSDQQQEQLKQQADKPYSVTFMAFTNFDTLITHGATTDQENNLKQAFFTYFVSLKQKIYTVVLDPASIRKVLHDPAAADYSTLSFNVSFDNGTSYKAKMALYNASPTELFLFDNASGAQVYDSGKVDSFNTN